MKKFLSSVGFKYIKTSSQLKILMAEVINSSSEKYFYSEPFRPFYNYDYACLYKPYGKNIGLTVRGVLDDKDDIKAVDFLAYTKSDLYMNAEFININEGDKENEYFITCEDENDNEIVFYLLNPYYYFTLDNIKDNLSIKISISGLSVSGKVILPIDKNQKASETEIENFKKRCEIIKKSKKGDEDAINELECNAEQTYNSIYERLKNEDLLSIIETYMMPDSSFNSGYSILGDIINVEEIVNEKTEEKVYCLRVNAISTVFDVFINSKDIIGMPFVGMRFLGNCFLQGYIL